MVEILEGWSPARWRTAARTGAVVLPLLTCAVLYGFRDDLAAATDVLILVLLVVGAAATGDRAAGLLAAVSCGAWFDFFLAPPYLTFTIDSAGDIEAAVLLVLISVAVTEVALWGRRQQARASRRAGYLDGILGAARAVAAGRAASSPVTDVVARQVAEVLGVEDVRFVPGPIEDSRIAILDTDGVLTRDGHEIDVDRVGLPVDEYVAVPVRKGPRVVGCFLLTAADQMAYPSREQRRVAMLLADQVAAADVFPMRRLVDRG